MTYGAQTWPLTARLIHKLQVAQLAMKRAMLGISLRDHGRVSFVGGPMDVEVEWRSCHERVGKRSVGRPQLDGATTSEKWQASTG
ncbi:jg21724 [Pararge aegeria aegeria]|uniref:Jg21724 protein n=1 Tax=Pararge aegeria aegeria TaxID=348720 RepID=A0A8S4S7W9_9NEOP|nr:jg21724 [Pararge aegeria aegeria]